MKTLHNLGDIVQAYTDMLRAKVEDTSSLACKSDAISGITPWDSDIPTVHSRNLRVVNKYRDLCP